MILHKNIWIWEYFSCIKSNVFIILQIFLAVSLINNQLDSIAWETELLGSIADADSDTYLFQYALAACGLFDDNGSYTTACDKIRSLPGIEKIGEIFDTSISVIGDSEKYPEDSFEINALDSVATAAVTYNIREGRWLNESDREGDVIHAVLGGEIAKRYKIGDTIMFELDMIETSGIYEIEVVGKLTEHCNKLELCGLSGDSGVSSFMTEGENDIFINYNNIFHELKKDSLGHSTAHCIVKLNKDADKNFLSNYGKLVSFEEMMQESREELDVFIKDAAVKGSIWTIVIIFGIIATSYLVGKRRRYVWGIYLMLGEKPKKLFKIRLINNSITYMVGTTAALSLLIYEACFKNEEILFMRDVSIYHFIIDVAFLLIMMVISLISNLYILKIEPKEILTQTKE